MHLDKDVEKMAKGVTAGCIICCAVEIIVCIILGLTGIISLNAGMFLLAAGGTAVEILCFWWMASSLQKSLDKAAAEGAQVNKGVQTGYNKRLGLQALWIIAAIFIPYATYGDFVGSMTICGLLPLLFSRFAIFGLRAAHRL